MTFNAVFVHDLHYYRYCTLYVCNDMHNARVPSDFHAYNRPVYRTRRATIIIIIARDGTFEVQPF